MTADHEAMTIAQLDRAKRRLTDRAADATRQARAIEAVLQRKLVLAHAEAIVATMTPDQQAALQDVLVSSPAAGADAGGTVGG